MSAIGGVFALGKKRLSLEPFKNLEKSLSTRVYDTKRSIEEDHYGLISLQLHTTPESIKEKQPYYDPSNHLFLQLDGRIDNRNELKKKLNIKQNQLTDIELLRFCFLKWGGCCAKEIVGSFSFSIFDISRNRIHLARDHIGSKPLFYFIDKNKFIFSSGI